MLIQRRINCAIIIFFLSWNFICAVSEKEQKLVQAIEQVIREVKRTGWEDRQLELIYQFEKLIDINPIKAALISSQYSISNPFVPKDHYFAYTSILGYLFSFLANQVWLIHSKFWCRTILRPQVLNYKNQALKLARSLALEMNVSNYPELLSFLWNRIALFTRLDLFEAALNDRAQRELSVLMEIFRGKGDKGVSDPCGAGKTFRFKIPEDEKRKFILEKRKLFLNRLFFTLIGLGFVAPLAYKIINYAFEQTSTYFTPLRKYLRQTLVSAMQGSKLAIEYLKKIFHFRNQNFPAQSIKEMYD